jgi:predicted lipoprotein with Yx(FWY)xxD motif
MKKLFFRGIVLSLLIFSISSCKKNTTAPEVLRNDINLSAGATFGKYLTNKQGRSLYIFADDADGINTCTGGCESTWPAFTTDLTTATLDTALTAADFAIITNANGKKQVTYKGWPLHTYSPSCNATYGNTGNSPEPPGLTNGDGIDGVWFVAKPDYTIMLANKQLTGLDGNNYKSDYTVGNGNTVYFTSGAGNTIYTFSVDSFNINKFTRPDLSNNATFPVYEQDKIVVPSVLNKALFGNIDIAGKKQMTYNGWPLYFFGQDAIRGSNKGVSVPVPGKWRVAVKDIGEAAR